MKRKKKYIQQVPDVTSKKRAFAVMSVLGLSLSAVASFNPAPVGSVEEIHFETRAAQSDNQLRHISIIGENEETDGNEKTNVETEPDVENDYLSAFFSTEDSYVSIRNQKSTIDVDAILKKMEEEKKAELAKKAAQAKKALAYKASTKTIKVKNQNGQISDMTVPASIEFDENGLPINYSYCLEGRASAYCSGTTTATGTAVHEGSVAVNPSQIPYGTNMYIVSLDGKYVYGYCRAEDTGGFVYNGSGRVADLYMDSYSDCIGFGVRGVRIYVF